LSEHLREVIFSRRRLFEEGNGTFYINYNWKVLRAIINMPLTTGYRWTFGRPRHFWMNKNDDDSRFVIFWWDDRERKGRA
jgi:hypothetical protein